MFDRSTTVFVFLGFAMPSFWLALLMMDYLGVRLGIFPVAGLKSMGYDYMSSVGQFWDMAHHLIMPVFVSAFGGLAGFSRYMRSNMLEVIRQDFVRTARAKGLPERTVMSRPGTGVARRSMPASRGALPASRRWPNPSRGCR